jgi:putative GTP pyrophosphokinase
MGRIGTYQVPWPASKRQIDLAGDLVRAWWVDPAAPDIEHGSEIGRAAVLVYRFRQGFQDPLNRVTMGIRSMVASEGAPIVVSQRLKRLPSIVDKLARFPGMNLCRMQDIGGCRAIIPTRKHAQGTTRRIRKNWDVKRFDDYEAEPKPTGYRAIHAVVLRNGRLVEVQLRTPLQQRWAVEVDRTSGRLRVALKDGLGPSELVTAFADVAEQIAQMGEDADPDAVNRMFARLRRKVREYL